MSHDEKTERGRAANVELERLSGTKISGISFDTNQTLEILGDDCDGEAIWRLRIGGSARFTFSHTSENGTWLVEANFDAGGVIRSSERAMMQTLCGALVASFRAEENGLFIRSGDGRAIEIPYALNEEGIILDILTSDDNAAPVQMVFPLGLDGARSGLIASEGIEF